VLTAATTSFATVAAKKIGLQMKRDLTTISATLSGHYWITRFQGSSVLPEQSVQQGNAGNIA